MARRARTYVKTSPDGKTYVDSGQLLTSGAVTKIYMQGSDGHYYRLGLTGTLNDTPKAITDMGTTAPTDGIVVEYFT